jgi:hypothetical protein
MNLPITADWLFLQIITYSAENFQNIRKNPAGIDTAGIPAIWPPSFIDCANLGCKTNGRQLIKKITYKSYHQIG